LCLRLSHIAHESCNYTQHTSRETRGITRGITTPHASRATTPRTCRATSPPTPAQERDGHVRNTQRCMHPAASSTSETEKQRPGPWHTPKTHHARRSRREWNCSQRGQMHESGALHTDNIVHTGSWTDVHIITYRHITHRYTPAPPRVSYHVRRHDDEGRCLYPKRCSRRMPGTSPRPSWVQHVAPRRQPTTERSAGGRGGR